MGEITFFADGFATTIHDDGSKSTTPLVHCFYCDTMDIATGGRLLIIDEVETWQCSKCRK